MIFRLEYCNKASVTARVDIQKGAATPIYTVEGTADPFTLFYNNDKGDKSGSFRSSGADINIYKTTDFNIDELKTSNETEISVKYYINNILNWSGFVIPDFFSETITGGQGVVSMVASDRLGTLKGVTLSGLSETVKISSLISQCLAKTGLSLSVNTKASFTSVAGSENVFESRVLSQRMIDMRGRRVSCYDILYSILVMTNSVVMQRHGEWWIANKIDWEAGAVLPTQQYHNFDDVSAGARRHIVPVASSVGVYHEFGGGRKYPSNHDFSIVEQTVPSIKFHEWTSFNSFVQAGNTLSVIGYSGETPIYGKPSIPMLKNVNESFNSFVNPDDQKYLMSTGIDIMSASSTSAQVNIEVSATGRNGSSFIVMVLADNGTNRYAMTKSGSFVAYNPVETQPVFLLFDTYDKAKGASDAVTRVSSYSGRLELENIDNYKIYIRIYGAGAGKTLFVNSASVTFAASVEIPSGNIYKTEQGDVYTKRHDTDTTIFGDYISGGLNGYFYNYMPDDVSSLMTSTGQPTTLWTTPADGEPLPLLQHITRQKARMFSVAHDLLSADIATSTFDPLSIFVDCDSNRYVVVSARFDFLRSNVSVELEEVAYTTNSKRDYIYSYFGEGEEGISSIAGIAGGYTPSTGITIPPIPDPKLSELRAYLDIIDSDVATLTGTYNQINESTVIDGATKASLTTLFTAVTDAAGAYKTYALAALEDEVLTEEELAQLEILKQAYIDAVGAFKAVADPIITSLISVSLLKQNLQTYTSDKAQIDLVWSIISNNIYLVEPNKTTYDNAKSAYDTAYTAIANKINSVIADGMATPAELAEVGTLTTAYLTALASYRSAEEAARKAIIDEQKRQTQEYAETQWQDVIDTQEALEQSLLNFSESINPITAQMMQLIVGDESLQYIFVESKVNPVRVSHSVSYDTVEKKLTVYAGWIKHLTLGITDISPEHTYKFWHLPLFTSDALTDPDKSYYLYAKCSDTFEIGEFVLSEAPIAIDAVSGYHHLLVGILNAENNLTRRFAPLYGLTEVLPGRITLDKIVSVDGRMVIDLINNTITSPTLKISSGGSDKDLGPYLDETAQDIQDAQASANAAALAAQQAIEAAEANVATINAEVGRLQDQIDGKVSNWYYAYTPTLSNYPASDWTTNEIKDSHIGDTFTNTEPAPAENAGKSWRFVKNGSTYSWIVISDSDAIKALQEASKAQATADGKSTTYLFQPTKYKLGDMWVLNDDYTVNGTAYKQGDLLTATQDSETFVQAHWLKRVRYTDDTAINELEIGGRNLLLNSDFSRGFNYYWGRLNNSPASNFEIVGTALKATFVEGSKTDFGKTGFIQMHDFSSTDNIIISAMIKGEGDLKIRFGATQNPVLHINNEIFKKFTQIIPKSNFGNGSLIFEVSSGELLFDRLKLERGTKATDWTPAPEDVEASIATAKIEAENAAKDHADAKAEAERVLAEAYADGIVSDEEQARIDDVNAKLAAAKAYADAQDALLKTQQEAYADGKISTAEQAAIQAAKDYADLKKTEAEAYADGIVSDEEARAIADALEKYNDSKAHAEQLVKDIEIGGRNLIVGSFNDWRSRTVGQYGSQLGFITIQDDWRGKTVTHSVEVKDIPIGESVQIRVDFFRPDNTYTATGFGNIVSLAGKLFLNYTVPTDTQFNRIRARISPVSYTANYDVLFRGEKLEFGNKATDWSPAPEDVQAAIDEAVVKATYWSVKASSPVIYKDAINAATSGVHTPVTISGELRSGTTSTSGGFITVTPNGGTEGTATASPVTIAPANGDGKTSYTVRLYDTASKTTLLDTQTIPVVFKGASGTNAINVVLGNEADVLPASSEGVVSDYSGSGTTIRVFEGATELSYGTGNGQYQVSASGSGITAGTPSTSGNTRVYGVASNMTADNATITFTISGKTADGVSFSFTKTQSFSKSRTGDKGADGEGGITISLSQQGYTYRADLNGDIIGSLANGMVELTIRSGSTPITCSSPTSGAIPTTNGTYTVTRTLGNGITTNQSLSGGKYRITPATLTVDEASVELNIKIMMGGVITSYPLTLTYRKQFDGAPGAPGTPGAPGADGFTITASKDTHSYVTYPGGDIKGYLDAGVIKLSVINGSTVLTCSSTSTSTPNTNRTYRVTNAVASAGLTITKSISGSQFVLYPATFTSNEGTVTLTIVARMNNTNHTFTKVVTYNKVSDGSDADMTEYEYLKDAIGQDAELTGALFTLVTILLKESMAADVTAGISGEQGASLDAPAFWSGGTYAQAIANTAKTILRHDGSGQLASGNIEWDDAGMLTMLGKLVSGVSGSRRIEFDPTSNAIKMYDSSNNPMLEIGFFQNPNVGNIWEGRLRLFRYYQGELNVTTTLSSHGIEQINHDGGYTMNVRINEIEIKNNDGTNRFIAAINNAGYGEKLHITARGLPTTTTGLLAGQLYKDASGYIKSV